MSNQRGDHELRNDKNNYKSKWTKKLWAEQRKHQLVDRSKYPYHTANLEIGRSIKD